MSTETMNDTGTVPGIETASNVVDMPVNPSGYARYCDMIGQRLIAVAESLATQGVPLHDVLAFAHDSVTGELPKVVAGRMMQHTDEKLFWARYGEHYAMHVFGMYAAAMGKEGCDLADIGDLVRQAYAGNAFVKIQEPA